MWDDESDSPDRAVDAHAKTLRAKPRAVVPELDPVRTHRSMGHAWAENLPPKAG